MKKSFCVLMAFILFLMTGCSKPEANPSISEGTVAKSIDPKTHKPVIKETRFSTADPAIYFSVKVTDLPKGTKLKALWKRLNDGTEVMSELTTEGTRYEVFTLKRSQEQFPPGQYEVKVTGEVGGQILEAQGKFEIAASSTPTHLINPLTCKAVDSEDKLNPIDITSEFSQSDPVIYFVVQSKDLPANSKVSCTWLYLDTEDSLAHEMITDGNRNIAFSLKPDPGQKLPAGRYIATASVTVDGQIESVSKEFEVKADDPVS